MRKHNLSWTILAGLCLVGTCLMAGGLGCRNGEETDQPEVSGEQPGENQTGQAAISDVPQEGIPADPPPPPPTIPEVNLADAQLLTCRIGKGDLMATGNLPDLDGNMHALGELFGEKLTVVCFWTNGNSGYTKMAAVDLLEFLGKDIAEPYAEKGVRVIGINEGDTATAVAEQVRQAETTFPTLLDPEGVFFANVVTEKMPEKMPRTFLLDAEGKILWFDIEYSRTTRRHLEQGIRVALGEI